MEEESTWKKSSFQDSTNWIPIHFWNHKCNLWSYINEDITDTEANQTPLTSHSEMLLLLETYVLSLWENWRSNGAGVVRLAVAAFLPDYVKVHFGRVVAVIAQNPYLQNETVIFSFCLPEIFRNQRKKNSSTGARGSMVAEQKQRDVRDFHCAGCFFWINDS